MSVGMSQSVHQKSPVRFVPRSGPTWRDPFAMYAALRDRDPAHHVPTAQGGAGDYWVLSRHADVFDAARDTATFSSASGLTFTYGEMERLGIDRFPPMVMLDPPDHTAFRRLVARGFTPSGRRHRTGGPGLRGRTAGSAPRRRRW